MPAKIKEVEGILEKHFNLFCLEPCEKTSKCKTTNCFKCIAGDIDGLYEPKTLTPREKEIVSAIADGKSNKEISVSAGISVTTVKAHCRSILEKLGAKNRSQAAVIFSTREAE